MEFNLNRNCFYSNVVVQGETYFPGLKKRIQNSESSIWSRCILQNTKDGLEKALSLPYVVGMN